MKTPPPMTPKVAAAVIRLCEKVQKAVPSAKILPKKDPLDDLLSRFRT